MYTCLYLVSSTEINCGNSVSWELSFLRTEIRAQFTVTVDIRCLGHLGKKTNKSQACGIFSTAVACCLESKWSRIWHTGSCGGIVGWRTVLQAGRLWVWLWLRIEIFHWRNPSSHTLALGSTHGLTEVSTNNISWGVKSAGAYGLQPYHLHVPMVLKSGSLNLLEPSGPVHACNGIALPLL